MRTLTLVASLLLTALASQPRSAAGQGTQGAQGAQEQRASATLELRVLTSAAAVALLRPHMRSDGAMIRESGPSAVYVTDLSTNIPRLRAVLAEHDRVLTAVTLTFELVHATDAASSTRRRSSVDSVLRSVLRYNSYEVLGTAMGAAGESSIFEQVIGFDSAGIKYSLTVNVGLIRTAERTVRLTVELGRALPSSMTGGGRGAGSAAAAYSFGSRETIIRTGLDVPIGQSVVLGTTAVPGMSGALVLVVRPELLKREP